MTRPGDGLFQVHIDGTVTERYYPPWDVLHLPAGWSRDEQRLHMPPGWYRVTVWSPLQVLLVLGGDATIVGSTTTPGFDQPRELSGTVDFRTRPDNTTTATVLFQRL